MLGIYRQELARLQHAIEGAGHDIGEGAAPVDPELLERVRFYHGPNFKSVLSAKLDQPMARGTCADPDACPCPHIIVCAVMAVGGQSVIRCRRTWGVAFGKTDAGTVRTVVSRGYRSPRYVRLDPQIRLDVDYLDLSRGCFLPTQDHHLSHPSLHLNSACL